MIKQAIIDNLDALSLSTTSVRVVDFGCSVGPNTFFAVQNLVNSVEQKCSLQGLDPGKLEFQVLFNDHTANDFNTLFASLPPERWYHAAAAPGSFHGRLLPRASITLAHSAYSLHWLSKVPQGLSNEGRIHYMGSSTEVVRAYADQFEKDMGAFVNARAQEIVGGGLMLLIIPGIPRGVNLSHLPAAVIFNFLGSSLMDLATEVS